MKIVDSQRMSAIDRRSQKEFAFPSILLMENAGLKACQALKRLAWGGRVPSTLMAFVCGKGNNGGDAFVMARQCFLDGAKGAAIVLADGRPEEGTDPAANLALCEALGIPVIPLAEREGEARALIKDAEWVFDGLSGTGLRGPLREPLSGLAAAINVSAAKKVAVDVPSGVGDGFRASFPAVRADITLTMGLPKLCLYLPHARVLCGRIVVVPLGFPPALVEDPAIPGELLEEGAFRALLPAIPPDAHKNQRGHLAVFAGSPGTTGAAWLAATAAARARAGLVTAFLGREEYPVLAAKLSSVMARPWDESADRAGNEFDPKRFSAVLAGPGWGLSKARSRWLENLLSLPLPGVVDADGLTLLSGMMTGGPRDLGGRWVLTPHPGEFSRLSGEGREEILEDPVTHALSLSRRVNAVIVLKGACTFVAAPSGKYWIFDGVNPAMATGGSGDVLAGIIAAGIAGGMEPLSAALFGVSLHGRVGRIARSKAGWFLAEDMVPLISRVLGRED
jgi:hydroxyethylthiazole kinase-like uncharacterized protein yjeF